MRRSTHCIFFGLLSVSHATPLKPNDGAHVKQASCMVRAVTDFPERGHIVPHSGPFAMRKVCLLDALKNVNRHLDAQKKLIRLLVGDSQHQRHRGFPAATYFEMATALPSDPGLRASGFADSLCIAASVSDHPLWHWKDLRFDFS